MNISSDINQRLKKNQWLRILVEQLILIVVDTNKKHTDCPFHDRSFCSVIFSRIIVLFISVIR
jgi:hypothetical protein